MNLNPSNPQDREDLLDERHLCRYEPPNVDDPRQWGNQPRQCDDCCLKTTKIVCPRCGGQCDIDETSDYYCPEGTL